MNRYLYCALCFGASVASLLIYPDIIGACFVVMFAVASYYVWNEESEK